MGKPTVKKLTDDLVGLIDWAVFAQHLPGIKERHIQKIEKENKGKLDDEKRALYRKWLQVYPKATWNDVIKALVNAEREDIAEIVKQKEEEKTVHQDTNEGDQQQQDITNTLNTVVKDILPLKSVTEENFPKLVPEKQKDGDEVALAVSDPVVKIGSKCSIKIEIEALFGEFTALVAKVQKELRIAIEKEPSLLLDITTFARDYVRDKNLPMQDNIYDLFAILQAHYDFLNCELIDAIIDNFLKGHQLQADMKHYLEELDSVLDSPTLLDIKGFIKEGLIATHNGTETTCKVVIRLTGRWGKFSFKVFRDVIHFIIGKELIAHIDIITGSLLVTFLAPVSHSLDIAWKALTKIEFMHRIGIIEMYISNCGNDHYIMEPQDEENINYDHSLLEAAEEGYDFDMSVLIKLGANVNCIHMENGVTALMLASENGHYQVVELLLKEHADVNHQRQDGVTALMLASQNGHYQIVEMLLKEHADVNHQKQNGVTTLMLASQNGHYQVVEMLLKEHADVNHQTQNGITALMLASGNDRYQVVKLLLKEHADVNHQMQNGITALMLAGLNGHYQVVESLLKEHADVSCQTQDGATALMAASKNGHHQIVELLIKEHANVNHQRQDGVTALMAASKNGHYQVVELLIKEHADVNHQAQDGVTALMSASENGHYQVVELLIKEHANVNHQRQDGVTALMAASKNGHYQVVEMLLKEHADVNHQAQDGVTALMSASENGHYQVMELLLQKLADVNHIGGCRPRQAQAMPGLQFSTGSMTSY